ncbi:hypothetical protein AMST5_00875 [freshwater sediment metagenome]|uniref:Insertion element IS402-like domain-containing protein n=1 Tax=freshwater sediment metagenome TaxID=556182 RepID=A0AA48LXM2_9ZZZZ
MRSISRSRFPACSARSAYSSKLASQQDSIVYFIKNKMQWKDAPKGYGPHKTLYNRFFRWSRLGAFEHIFAALAAEGPKPERISEPFQKRGFFPVVLAAREVGWIYSA